MYLFYVVCLCKIKGSNMISEQIISKCALIHIYNSMVANKRTSGFMDFTSDGVLRFFDINPFLGGIGACPITIQEVKVFIEEYDIINS